MLLRPHELFGTLLHKNLHTAPANPPPQRGPSHGRDGGGRWAGGGGWGGGVRAASEPIKRRLRGAELGRAGLGEAGAIVPGLGAAVAMREIVHIQAGQCGNQIGTKVSRGG